MKKLFSFLFFIFCFPVFGQGLIAPVHSDIYDFLEQISVAHKLEYSKLIQPQDRLKHARMLIDLHAKRDLLTPIEQDRLNWFEREYNDDIKAVADSNSFAKMNIENRWHLYHYNDGRFRFTFDPLAAAELHSQYGALIKKRWFGFNISASLGKNWGFYLDFRDNGETGNNLDSTKRFSPATGIQIIGGSGNSIEYSDVRGGVSYEDNYITLTAAKEPLNWGSGYRSRLILSDKAPSFPFIRFDLHPVSWLNFYYIHAWLNSRVPDTNLYYRTLRTIPNVGPQLRLIDREKFFAAHIIEIIPWKGVRCAIGESIVYSDQGPRLGFLIPFLFFRLVDHYYEGANAQGKGGNSQLFSDFNISLLKNYSFYASLFIDEFSLTQFLKGETGRNQSGMTFGAVTYPLLGFDGLTARLEYTRILPWVYSNFVQTQTYMNSGYLMGHYIGQNSYQLFGELQYAYSARLQGKLWLEHNAIGGFGDVNDQYDNTPEEFLYPPVRKETNIGFSISYNILHDLVYQFTYQHASISDEDLRRTPEYMRGNFNQFWSTLRYGL